MEYKAGLLSSERILIKCIPPYYTMKQNQTMCGKDFLIIVCQYRIQMQKGD